MHSIENLDIQFFPQNKDILNQKCKKIEEFDLFRLEQLSKKMFEKMYEYSGVGLAAPQLGLNEQIAVIDNKEGFKETIVNPEILEYAGDCSITEACLSIPDFHTDVPRRSFIKLKYYDINGKEKTIEARGMLAIILQHEIDHLFGRLIIDYVSDFRKSVYEKKKNKKEENKKKE